MSTPVTLTTDNVSTLLTLPSQVASLSTAVSEQTLTTLLSGVTLLSTTTGPGYVQILSTPTALTIGSRVIGNKNQSDLIFIPSELPVSVNVPAIFFPAS
jgi:hypothetical protein